MQATYLTREKLSQIDQSRDWYLDKWWWPQIQKLGQAKQAVSCYMIDHQIRLGDNQESRAMSFRITIQVKELIKRQDNGIRGTKVPTNQWIPAENWLSIQGTNLYTPTVESATPLSLPLTQPEKNPNRTSPTKISLEPSSRPQTTALSLTLASYVQL